MSATYDFDQQVFCLNTISNLASGYTGTCEQIATQTGAAINSILSDEQVQTLIGEWSCVWGPKVVAAEGKALNTMYIAYNEPTNQYVVAIAGTDPSSVLDWFLEDFLVTTKVDWPYGGFNQNPNPMTSFSTFIGLNALIGMAEVAGNSHIHARDYLKSVSAQNVMVTGHSLGGALSPSYALYLQDTIEQWAEGRNVNISCMPVAGATPGDKAFSDYYTERLGANTTRVWNASDVVPHGFQQNMLCEISNIFEPQNSTPIKIKAAVAVIKTLTLEKNYTQLMPEVAGFSPAACNNATTFDDELICQHICAYGDYFQINIFQAAVQRILNLTNPFFSAGCS